MVAMKSSVIVRNLSGPFADGETITGSLSGASGVVEEPEPAPKFEVGDIVRARGEPHVLYEIIKIRWSCPPTIGGQADLKFWGMHPDVDEVTRGLLNERDLKNDIFGSFTKDLNYPDNEMETLAISAQ
jgi:hypothetical protein